MSGATTIPKDQPILSPYLVVSEAARAIEFYMHAFGARELYRLKDSSGKIGHAELDVGGSRLMLADEWPDFGALGPQKIGGSPVALHLYVEDVDAVTDRALSAGATILRPLRDEFFGDRVALIADPFGHRWHLATRKEAVTPEEMQRRWNAAMSG